MSIKALSRLRKSASNSCQEACGMRSSISRFSRMIASFAGTASSVTGALPTSSRGPALLARTRAGVMAKNPRSEPSHLIRSPPGVGGLHRARAGPRPRPGAERWALAARSVPGRCDAPEPRSRAGQRCDSNAHKRREPQFLSFRTRGRYRCHCWAAPHHAPARASRSPRWFSRRRPGSVPPERQRPRSLEAKADAGDLRTA